jgi:fatty acid desaturase
MNLLRLHIVKGEKTIMKKNMANVDKWIRLLLVMVILTLVITKVLMGIISIVLLLVALLLIFTSLFGFCPIYKLLGIRTNRREREGDIRVK